MKIAQENARAYRRRTRVQDTKAVRTKRLVASEKAEKKRAEREALELEGIFDVFKKGMWL